MMFRSAALVLRYIGGQAGKVHECICKVQSNAERDGESRETEIKMPALLSLQ